MDMLKKGLDSVKNKGSNKEGGSADAGKADAGGKQDYGDKAFGKAVDSSGYGSKVSAENREKITDGARGFYEKQTGSKIDPKYSN